MATGLSALRASGPFSTGRFLILISVRGLVTQIANFSDFIENGTRDFPACTIVPQQTTLPRAPLFSERLTVNCNVDDALSTFTQPFCD
jgi:hypothetical protein